MELVEGPGTRKRPGIFLVVAVEKAEIYDLNYTLQECECYLYASEYTVSPLMQQTDDNLLQ